MFSRPVRRSSTAAYWPVSPIRVRTSWGSATHVDPVDQRRAGVGAQQRGEDPDRRGLAGSVRAEQAVDRATRDLEVDTAEGDVVAEALDQAGGVDRQIR